MCVGTGLDVSIPTSNKQKIQIIINRVVSYMHLSKSVISVDMSISQSRVSPNSCKNLLSAFELVECCFSSSGMIGFKKISVREASLVLNLHALRPFPFEHLFAV